MASGSENSTSSTEKFQTPQKRECRERIIKHAVDCLTTERAASTCVLRDDVRRVWEKSKQSGEARCRFTEKDIELIEHEIVNWELFHDSQIQKKNPSDLRVCYLAGENPMNDFGVFISNGVLAQNIFAIEKDAKKIEHAWKRVAKSEFTKTVKLFTSDIITFLKTQDEPFDIIYIDACGSIPSKKQETLKLVGYVFLHNKLASPGALITNFSFPPRDDDSPERKNLREFTQGYLKHRLKNTGIPKSDSDTSIEELETFLAKRTDEDNYSDYITYQLIDTAYIYIPLLRMLSKHQQKSLYEHLFMGRDDLKDIDNEKYGLSQNYLIQLGQYMESNTKDNVACEYWVNEVFPDWKDNSDLSMSSIKPLLLTHVLTNSLYLLHKFANKNFMERCLDICCPIFSKEDEEKNEMEEVNEEKKTTIKKKNERNEDKKEEKMTAKENKEEVEQESIDTLFQRQKTENEKKKEEENNEDDKKKGDKEERACREPNPGNRALTVSSLLYGQMAHPSLIVPEKLLRLKYTGGGRGRQMFADVLIFDKCKYIFGQFPSLHFALFGFYDPQISWVVNAALDCLKQRLNYICKDVFEHFHADLTPHKVEIAKRIEVNYFIHKRDGQLCLSDSSYKAAVECFRKCQLIDDDNEEIKCYINFCEKRLGEKNTKAK